MHVWKKLRARIDDFKQALEVNEAAKRLVLGDRNASNMHVDAEALHEAVAFWVNLVTTCCYEVYRP